MLSIDYSIWGHRLVQGVCDGDIDVMPASWVCPLDYQKMSAVIDSTHYTRKLIEKSGYMVLSIPGQGIQKEVMYLGSVSKNDNPNKIEDSGVKFFNLPGCDFPLVEGCAGWAVCKIIPEPENQRKYDLLSEKLLQLGPMSAFTAIITGIWKTVLTLCAPFTT